MENHTILRNWGTLPIILMRKDTRAKLLKPVQLPPRIIRIAPDSGPCASFPKAIAEPFPCIICCFAVFGAENAPGPWQTAGMFANSRSMTIDGPTPGTLKMGPYLQIPIL
jgi:hypothetical protein